MTNKKGVAMLTDDANSPWTGPTAAEAAAEKVAAAKAAAASSSGPAQTLPQGGRRAHGGSLKERIAALEKTTGVDLDGDGDIAAASVEEHDDEVEC